MATSQAMAGQVSGGGPSAIKAEEYILSAADFHALRENLRKLGPQSHELSRSAGGDEPFVIRDEAGQLIIIKKSLNETSENPQ
jgi:hypothetical protein